MRPTRSATHDRCKRSPIRRLGTEDWRIDSEDWRLSAGDRRAKTAAEDEDEDEDGEEDQDEAVEEQPANFISRNKSMTDLCTAQSLQITNVYVYWMNVRLQFDLHDECCWADWSWRPAREWCTVTFYPPPHFFRQMHWETGARKKTNVFWYYYIKQKHILTK